MAKPITAYGINGMNNIRLSGGYLLDDNRRVTPRIVLNADVSDDGRVEKRGGYDKILSRTASHSLWKGTVILVVDNGSLYRLDDFVATEIADLTGPKNTPMFYAEVDGVVYMGNGFWRGTYEVSTQALRDHGLSLPPTPEVTPCAGNLPEGRYSMCFTRFSGERLGGNGPILTLSWTGGVSGIKLLNMPSDCLFWLTQPNGDTLYWVSPDSNNEVVNPYFVQELPTFEVIQPPYLKHLCIAHGRLWGSKYKTLYYSEPYKYEWFREANAEPFSAEIQMLAPYQNGIYISSRTDTWAFDTAKDNPLQWSVRRVGDGAIPGTLIFALVEGGGYEISRTLSQLPSPIWMDGKGVVVGTATGHLVHLSETRVNVNRLTEGAGLFREIDGRPQIIMSLRGIHERPPNSDTRTIFERGKLH